MNRKEQILTENYFSSYFQGEKLYGDDFSVDEIQKWFEEEKEGYAGLVSDTAKEYYYSYHQLNILHGYKYLPNRFFSPVLSVGGAYGYELLPIIGKIDNIFILEPSKYLRQETLMNKPLTYIEPTVEGLIPFPDGYFELITCFGVLHHIPNVTAVLKEVTRILKRGGFLLIREAIISMGDWRKPRKGLTKNERGIPIQYFYSTFERLNLRIQKGTPCMFSVIGKIGRLLHFSPFNSKALTKVDKFLSSLFLFNYTYHPQHFVRKFSPTAYFFVLVKK